MPAVVAFVVTTSISAYIALSSQISADSSANTLEMTISLTNWWGDSNTLSSSGTNEQAAYMKYVKDQKYRCSTAKIALTNAVGKSSDSDQVKVQNNKSAIWAAAYEIAIASDLTTYNGTKAFIDVTKSSIPAPTDDQIGEKLKNLVNVNSTSYRCQGTDSVSYSKALKIPTKYQSGKTSQSTTETKTIIVTVMNEEGKPDPGAIIKIDVPYKDGTASTSTCDTDSDGKCTIRITNKGEKVDLLTKLHFIATLTNKNATGDVGKKWSDIKTNDSITLSAKINTSGQEVALPAIEKTDLLEAPGANSITGVVKVTNSKTKRILTGVEVEITSSSDKTSKIKTTTPIPPNPEGIQVAGFAKGTYTVIAKRYGYEIFQTDLTVTEKNQYFNIDIAMKPVIGLPDPDSEYQNSLSSLLRSNSISGLGSSNISLINKLMQYLGSGTSTSGFPYLTGYSNNTSQTAVVPIMLSIQPQYPYTTLSSNARFNILNTQTGFSALSATINLATLGTLASSDNQSIVRYGCLNPNTQYTLKVTNLSNSSLSAQPYKFTSGSYGQGVILGVPVQAAMVLENNISYSVVDRSTFANNITCPSTSLSSISPGQNTWTGQTISDVQLKAYSVYEYGGKYFLINPAAGSSDIRQIRFVLPQGSTGGLAFVSAASGTDISASNQSGWYVTTFTLTNGKPIIDQAQFTRTNLSPDDYKNSINSSIIESSNSGN